MYTGMYNICTCTHLAYKGCLFAALVRVVRSLVSFSLDAFDNTPRSSASLIGELEYMAVRFGHSPPQCMSQNGCLKTLADMLRAATSNAPGV